MVVDSPANNSAIHRPSDFRPTLLSYLWSGRKLREFYYFLFVHLSASASSIVPGNWYFPAFRPASEIDVQSLLRGLCFLPNNKAVEFHH